MDFIAEYVPAKSDLLAWLQAGDLRPGERKRYLDYLAWYDRPAAMFIAPTAQPENEEPEGSPETEEQYLTGYPVTGLAAIVARKWAGWRLWAACKALDTQGEGQVPVERVRAFLDTQGMPARQERRWINEAVRCGFVTKGVTRRGVEMFFPISPNRLLVRLRQISPKTPTNIWKPARMNVRGLLGKDGRKYLWAAFLVTLKGRPMSQARKWALTGIEPRVQRLWQLPGKDGTALSFPVFNYSTSPVASGHTEAMREITGWNFFESKSGDVRQRLPDGRVVYENAAQRMGSGKRTGKVREKVETALQLLGFDTIHQGNCDTVRLFHVNHDRAKTALRKLNNVDHERRPLDIFEKLAENWRVNTYHALQVSEVPR